MDENALIEHVTRQRWYGAKSRTVSHAELLDTIVLRQAERLDLSYLRTTAAETSLSDLLDRVLTE